MYSPAIRSPRVLGNRIFSVTETLAGSLYDEDVDASNLPAASTIINIKRASFCSSVFFFELNAKMNNLFEYYDVKSTESIDSSIVFSSTIIIIISIIPIMTMTI